MQDNVAFDNRGAGFDVAGQDVPPELWEQTLALLREQAIAGKKPSTEDAVRAAKRTGLKKWFVDNGVNLANLAVTLLAYAHH